MTTERVVMLKLLCPTNLYSDTENNKKWQNFQLYNIIVDPFTPMYGRGATSLYLLRADNSDDIVV